MSLSYPRIFLLLAALSALSGCGDGKTNPGDAPPPLPVSTLSLELKAVPLVFDAVGQTEGSREIEVRARVSGILEKRVYSEGESVKPGAVLFIIDRAPFEIALRQARATLGEEQARQEQASRDVARLRELAEERAIGQREYEQAQATYKQSTAAISGAEASVSEAQLNLSYTTVTAPIGGITGRALRSEGSLVTANTDNALLTTLTQIDPIWVRFSLSSAEYERLRATRARPEVRLLNQDGSVAASDGRLNFAASTVDRAVGTVQMRAEFRNTGMRWLPGQYVKTQVLAGEQQAFLVPQSAVIQNEQGRAVWVLGPDNKVNPRPIQTANWIGSDWVVSGGVQAGEQIVVDNLMKLRPGAGVQRNAPAPAAAATPAR